MMNFKDSKLWLVEMLARDQLYQTVVEVLKVEINWTEWARCVTEFCFVNTTSFLSTNSMCLSEFPTTFCPFHP